MTEQRSFSRSALAADRPAVIRFPPRIIPGSETQIGCHAYPSERSVTRKRFAFLVRPASSARSIARRISSMRPQSDFAAKVGATTQPWSLSSSCSPSASTTENSSPCIMQYADVLAVSSGTSRDGAASIRKNSL